MKHLKWLLAVLVLLIHMPLQPTAASRSTIKLEKEWRFIQGDPAGASANAFDASGWEVVTIPHTWNARDWSEAGYYRGPGWYRRGFTLSEAWRGKRVFVRFEAAASMARVFVNGNPVGEHKGAFAAFCFEITSHVQFGALNHLAVWVSNAKVDDMPPISGDFNIFGGLYRAVTLFARDPVCITPLDHGSSGIAAKQLSVNGQRAELMVTAKISNGGTASSSNEVFVRIVNAAGITVASAKQNLQVPPGQTHVAELPITVLKPYLWDGVRDPYLYSLAVEVRADNRVLDSVTEPLGLRSMKYDPELGFILNGKSYPIRGVDRHQDIEGRGWAISEAEQDADMRLVREIGANGIRLAHYQHSDYFYSLCDRAGLVVWAEIPLVNEVTPSEAFAQNAQQQLRELIRQNINHPSVIVWSIFNEVGLRTKADPTPLVKILNTLAKAEDPTRPTVGATSQGEFEKYREMVATPDLVAGNLYPGWYSGNPADMDRLLDQFNRACGFRGFGVSEYGAGASIQQHEQGMQKRPDPRGRWHPEEWQALVHEQHYAAIQQRPFVWASFVWNMFDFASAGRTEGDRDGVNDKGLVTYDRKTKKDAFYFYKANWTRAPMVYIASRRHVERKEPATEVKVYSNCDRVELKVNGKSYGPAAGDSVHVFHWTGVELIPGANLIEAQARQNGKVIKDFCRFTLVGAGSRRNPS